ncbi:SCO6745 family protein [Fodinicola feengrottensis]|uniref:SalK n=1 Tax=Fodinicola feengrottensis TaxID=435914 RepID=A0ABN2FWM3_9ACTN|nr:hypothetical protein [Fodinicola feengrottensis]
MWRLVEGYHAPVYFAPQAREEYAAAGLRGFWMGYVAGRSGPLGAVPPEVVTAMFYNFAAARIDRALPDAWSLGTPADAVAAHQRIADLRLRELLGDGVDDPALGEVAKALAEVVVGLDPAGRPLFAAHAALAIPDAPHLALWWATTALREFRGDGHVAALLTAGLDGCEANVLAVVAGQVPEQQREFRGWTEPEWEAAINRLRERGWLDADDALTDRGRQVRTDVEELTDRLAASVDRAVEAGFGVDRLLAALRPVVARTVEGVPFPNPIGLPE